MRTSCSLGSSLCLFMVLVPNCLSVPLHEFHMAQQRSLHEHLSQQSHNRYISKRHAATTGSSNESTIAELRQTIAELEGYQRYYQHLLLRGYLSDDDTRRLENLQRLIDQMKDALRSTEDGVET